jgi:hypothetical protein
MAKRIGSPNPWLICSGVFLFSSLLFFTLRSFSKAPQVPLGWWDDSDSEPAVEAYKAPKKNIWSDLDNDEFDDVLKFLYNVPNELNLTRIDNATA